MLSIGRTVLTSFALAAFAAATTRPAAQAPSRSKLDHAAAAGGQDTIHRLDYPNLARMFLGENGLEDWIDKPQSDRHFEEALDSPAFVRVELGALDLCIPRKSLEQPDTDDEICAAAVAILDMEASWLDWRCPAQAKDTADDWKNLAKWVKTWSHGRLAHAEGGKSLYDSLNAPEAVRTSSERLRTATRLDDQTIKKLGEVGCVLLAPTRRDYLQVLALAGSLDESMRESCWNDNQLERTLQWVGWTEVVCMEYTSLPLDPESPFVGVNINEHDKTGLAQFMSERAAALLLRREFWRQEAHFFEQSLAADLVIAAAGKNNLRSGMWNLESYTSGSSTQPYERFVPGGNPGGGTLPARPAGPGVTTGNEGEVSLYRKTQGADHFIAPLREGQLAGAKLVGHDKKQRLSEDRMAHFALHSFAARADRAVTAPFLGALAEKQPLPPDEFLDDYEEFFRAYRVGFLFWLQSKALPNEDDSKAKFGELIAAHEKNTTHAPMDDSIQAVYGVPLSNADGSVDSLEWRYLTWLSKKK